ncbi:hypothetical protein PV08_08287 [Exophiala spinifera]|uniref:Uncharacterized protein n=1 Tax=Exophiala spinifera TaxID=91928 RepID=A0A0D2B3A9_9EURO|nr:uncharacterized protein PV08_08287 [Exophiala spinifera]KIW13100.1 hypothetical protein PV08_08287 [Exophiala spinifera]
MRSFVSLSFSFAILSSLSAVITASPAPLPQGSEANTTTTASYENPFTVYTTETNSLGVITGMPSVVTSQPSVVTSQPVSPTLPSYSGYVYANSTAATSSVGTETETATSAAGQSTTGLTGSVPLSTTTTLATSAGGSSSASATFAAATGGAVSNKVAGAGIGLVIMGLGFSLL